MIVFLSCSNIATLELPKLIILKPHFLPKGLGDEKNICMRKVVTVVKQNSLEPIQTTESIDV